MAFSKNESALSSPLNTTKSLWYDRKLSVGQFWSTEQDESLKLDWSTVWGSSELVSKQTFIFIFVGNEWFDFISI